VRSGGDVTISARRHADDAMMYWSVSTGVESVSTSRVGKPRTTRSLTDGQCPAVRPAGSAARAPVQPVWSGVRCRLKSRRAGVAASDRKGERALGSVAAVSPSATDGRLYSHRPTRPLTSRQRRLMITGNLAHSLSI